MFVVITMLGGVIGKLYNQTFRKSETMIKFAKAKALNYSNLLINGNFKINPRGKSSYSTNSTSIVRTVAMWRIQAGTGNSSVNITVNDDGTLTVTNNTSAMGYFVQAFHEPFEEGDYTASMNLLSKTGSISFAINDCMDAAQEVNNGFNAFTGNGSPSRVTFYLGTGSSMKIQYCKLEHGNIATTYFEEDDAIAKTRVQQYVLAIPQVSVARYSYRAGISYFSGFIFPIEMASKPNITGTYITSDTQTIDISIDFNSRGIMYSYAQIDATGLDMRNMIISCEA